MADEQGSIKSKVAVLPNDEKVSFFCETYLKLKIKKFVIYILINNKYLKIILSYLSFYRDINQVK